MPSRHFSACILLAVWALLFGCAFHTHDRHAEAETACVDCVRHLPHAHLSDAAACDAGCLLCRTLSLPYLAALSVVFSVFGIRLGLVCRQAVRVVSTRQSIAHFLRAPPMIFA